MNSHNESQHRAINASGHTLIHAGPGTGKTKTSVDRIIKEVNLGKKVVAVSFTRDSVRELKERLKAHIPNRMNRVVVGTFHSLAIRMLIDSGEYFRLTNDSEIHLLIDSIVSNHPFANPSEVRNYLKGGSQPVDEDDKLLAIVKDELAQTLSEHNAVNLGDVISHCNDLIVQQKQRVLEADYLLIDEFQDIDPVQLKWTLLHAFAGVYIVAVGDENQSIYGFRESMGVEAFDIIKSTLTIPSSNNITLDINYRSSQSIIDLGYNALLYNDPPPRYRITAHSEQQAIIRFSNYLSPGQEALDISQTVESSSGTWAILTRTNNQLDDIESTLKSFNVDHHRHRSDSKHTTKESQIVLSLTKAAIENDQFSINLTSQLLQVDKGDVLSITKTLSEIYYNSPCSFFDSLYQNVVSISKSFSLEKLKAKLHYYSKFSDPRAVLFEASTKNVKHRIQLMTIHRSKGLEFDCVWIPCMLQDSFPSKKLATSIDEERRLLFVAITRAKQRLHISSTYDPRYKDLNKSSNNPSLFLQELGFIDSDNKSLPQTEE